MQDFRELKVWQKSYQFALAIYRSTTSFPTDERYGLTSQLRRSASSVPTNLAEGCGRGSDFARFCQIAMGSACETECQLLLARDLGYLPNDTYDRLVTAIQEVKRMLASLIIGFVPELFRLIADG